MFLVGFVLVLDKQPGFVSQASLELLGSRDTSVFASQIPSALGMYRCTYWVFCSVFLSKKKIIHLLPMWIWCGFENLVCMGPPWES